MRRMRNKPVVEKENVRGHITEDERLTRVEKHIGRESKDMAVAPKGTPMELVTILGIAIVIAVGIYYWQSTTAQATTTSDASASEKEATPTVVVVKNDDSSRKSRWGEGRRLRDLWEYEGDSYYRRQMDWWARPPTSNHY